MEDLGAFLQQAREKMGLSIADIAEITKIRKRYLVAIEQGKTKELPDEVYLRGFLRSYAKALGICPEEIISLYEQSSTEIAQGLQRVSLVDRRRAARKRKRIKFFIGIAIIVIALVVYYFWFK